MPDLTQLRTRVATHFHDAFGRTPLAERTQDILTQATALKRFRDLDHLRDETGDLICSLLQLCTECGWEPEALAEASLARIESRHDIYGRLGRKLKVALLGGAFDPVHRSHVDIAARVRRLGGVDEVWLMPCFEHPGGKAMAPPAHRLEMCRLAVRNSPALGVFDYEIRHEFRGDLYHLIKKLLAEEVARARCDFSLVIGHDDADLLFHGADATALERLVPFIVVPRAGCAAPHPSAWYLKPPHQYLEESRLESSTSSTDVRQLLQAGDPDVARHLAPEVLDYIRAHGLYRPLVDRVAATCASRKVALFASTFEPASLFHRAAAETILREGYDEVIVCPTGPRPGKGDPEHAATVHRAALTDLTFRDLDRVRVDLTDLDEGKFCQPQDLEARHVSAGETWHVVGADMVAGGGDGRALIQVLWDKGEALWRNGRFLILHPPGTTPAAADLPPAHRLMPVDGHVPSADIRARVFAGDPVHGLLTRHVADYVARHHLFASFVPRRFTRLVADRPRLLIVFDERNPKAGEIAARYQPQSGGPPDLVLVVGGDGTMLHAIRRHWRLRVPFLGVNAGHLGFLMNERLPLDLHGLELVTYALPMLRVDAETADGRMTRGLAYGDVWLERDGGQAAWLRLDVDDQTRVPKIVGDGMLVSTASGSSAYARAMGAIPVPLNSPVLTLAGSNVFHPRFWKPMALTDDSVVKITSLDHSGKRPVRGFLDGQPLGVVQALTARRSNIAGVELAFTREFDPSGKLLRSLFPPPGDDF